MRLLCQDLPPFSLVLARDRKYSTELDETISFLGGSPRPAQELHLHCCENELHKLGAFVGVTSSVMPVHADSSAELQTASGSDGASHEVERKHSSFWFGSDL